MDHNHRLLGLSRLTTPDHQKEIEDQLTPRLEEVYDLIEGARMGLENLERTIDRILYGSFDAFSAHTRS